MVTDIDASAENYSVANNENVNMVVLSDSGEQSLHFSNQLVYVVMGTHSVNTAVIILTSLMVLYRYLDIIRRLHFFHPEILKRE